MALYEITEQYRNLFDTFDDADLSDEAVQAYFDTLEGIEGEFNLKASQVALFIKNLLSEAEEIKAEEDRLKTRRTVKQAKAKRLKEYLLTNMHSIGTKKIETAQAVISTRNNAESVLIDNNTEFINWAKANNCNLLSFKEPEISKTKVKEALKSGAKIPGASLVRTQSVIIK